MFGLKRSAARKAAAAPKNKKTAKPAPERQQAAQQPAQKPVQKPAAADTPNAAAAAKSASGDKDIVELAIEKALDGVRAELEAAADAEMEAVGRAEAGGERAQPQQAVAKAGPTQPDVVSEDARSVAENAQPVTSHEAIIIAGAPEAAAAIEPPRVQIAASTDKPAVAEGEPPAGAEATAGPSGEVTAASVATAAPQPKAGDTPAAGEDASQAAPAAPTPEQTAAQDDQRPLTQILARMTPPASLEDLGRAVNSSGGRSMDSIVEDIMRPIVRDWLVENLSAVAERIVREEIERISRRRNGS